MEPKFVLRVLKYPHPALRHKSKSLCRVDGDLKDTIRQMFDLMYEHKGIGLSANQVGLPYRLFVLNLDPEQKRVEDEQVFINPVIVRRSGTTEAEEGCLSFPEIYAPVKRSEKIVLSAYDLAGNELNCRLSGLPARAAQHEYDHLDGILFVDRMSAGALLSIKEALQDLELEFVGSRQRGAIPADEHIAAQLAELESLRT
jgi:peptide deformylase